MNNRSDWPSVNRLAAPLVQALIDQADLLRVKVDTLADGVTVVDAGIEARGGLEAGRRIAEICMGGLGRVGIMPVDDGWPLGVSVHSLEPVAACLASQYAGWSLTAGEGKDKYFALGSGPGRALACKEPLFQDLAYRDDAEVGVLVMEVDKPPPRTVVDKVLADCRLKPEALTFILTPTASLAGNFQVVARVLEVALHKAHELKFPLEAIVDGAGYAPLPAPGADFMSGMARTNDAILYGGAAHLIVDTDDAAAKELAERMPSSRSRDYGRSFGEIFKSVKYDFYQIDPMLFAPARVIVSSLKTGNTFAAGQVNRTLLDELWGRA